MKGTTPRWWYDRRTPAPHWRVVLLRPLSWIWAAVTAHRIATIRPTDPGIPVICVGDLTVGGTGKTPIVRALANRLSARGVETHILSRGYGGRLRGPLRVDPEQHRARHVGDEPLMLSSDAPVWISRDRLAGAWAILAAGGEAVLMDDGHQNPVLKKTLSLLVVDGETRDGHWPFGDVFPCGPMREPLEAGLSRADAVIVVLPADLATPDPALVNLFGTKPVHIAHVTPTESPLAGRIYAFAAIGKPWKFERALRASGCELVGFSALPDHASLPETTMLRLDRLARARSARLVTTEKDWVRLPASWRSRVAPWPVRANFDDPPALSRLLEHALTGA